MVDHDFNTAPGFALYGNDRKTRLLLPIQVADELESEAELAERKAAVKKAAIAAAETAKPTLVESKQKPTHPNISNLQKIDFDLDAIRTDTKYDLSDAMTLASRLLAKSTIALDRASANMSNDLLIAICMDIAYSPPTSGGSLIAVLDYLRDPLWDCNRQLFQWFCLPHKAFQQADAAEWLEVFRGKIRKLTDAQMNTLAEACYRHWTSVGQPNAKAVKSTKALGSIQVFDAEALEKAVVQFNELKDDRRAAGARILQNAHANNGNRTLPNPKAANAKLEAAKSKFENLVEPIGRLQMDLILSAAMKPNEFRITPLLLLGEPGIGKTFLATQLACALGVSTEKISAGGAQGGFQLTGSHSSWTGARPGLLFSLLAEGDSAAPVVVIDEVDKIRDAQCPVLPVLLDLLDAESSRKFKDEFFEMQFDASRVIFVMTANSIEDVPPALLSRVEVFDVPAPDPAQRLRIIQQTAANLCLTTRKRIDLDESTSEALSKRIDIDLRRVTRLVNEAFTKAMQAGDTVARIAEPKQAGKRSIGFH
ncbi:MAG: AAA family ATPase [Oxalobacteraceae bacterium]|nr:AAA family ATPase [Oxalobacteraceae bacterium]